MTETPQADPKRLENFLLTVRRLKEVFIFTDGHNGLPNRNRGEDGSYAAVPFFSSYRLAQKVQKEYEGYEIQEVPFNALVESVLPELHAMHIRIGMDWEANGLGFDMDALQLQTVLLSEKLEIKQQTPEEAQREAEQAQKAQEQVEETKDSVQEVIPVQPAPASNPYTYKFGADKELRKL